MHRSPRTITRIGTVAIAVLLTALLVVVGDATKADAQDPNDASLELAISDFDANEPFRTLAVSLDPGDSGMAALGATIHYETDAIDATACSVSEVGACNVTDDGRVLVSVFNLSGLKQNDQLLTLNFSTNPAATGATAFELTVDTAVSFDGSQLPPIEDVSVDVELAPVASGSLTGDVTDNDSGAGLFNLDVCVVNEATLADDCTTTSGLGTWRFDDLATGVYTVVISDSSGTYASAETTGMVRADEVVAGVDASMVLAATLEEAPEIEEVEVPTQEPTNDRPAPPNLHSSEPTVVVYEASITGTVTDVGTGDAVEAVQVCATQPLVLHQSCATTDADGAFALAELSTGNYWLTIVDPVGRFEVARSKLVGVVGDDVVRSGVELHLSTIAD